MKQLNDKVIVITGSTRGIGRAIADACGKAGAKLVICSRDEIKVDEVIRSFRKKGYKVAGIRADVSIVEDLKRLSDHAVAQWGRIDVWINNAGISTGFRLLEHVSDEELRKIVEINLTATLLACKMIIPYFKKQGRGILINMSGRGGKGDHSAFMVPYTATKAAITTMTKSLAEESSGYAISIHSVVPGMVKTDFFESIKTDEEGGQVLKTLPWVFRAFGMVPEVVGDLFVKLAAQEPGKVTGKNYSMLKGFRLIKGIVLMIWFKTIRKI